MNAIGVLALQGGFAAHIERLEALGHTAFEARTARDVERAAGFVLPGGESSAQLLMIERFGLAPAIRDLAESGRPVLATCAGAILAATAVTSPRQASFALIDIDVERNAYGRQRESFEAISDGATRLPLVFIRAPRIVRVGPDVRVLATLKGEPILVRQGNVTAATFHPELTDDPRVHRAVFGAGAREAAREAAGQVAYAD
jgi:5'-phosphate synthase pdxT subunit